MHCPRAAAAPSVAAVPDDLDDSAGSLQTPYSTQTPTAAAAPPRFAPHRPVHLRLRARPNDVVFVVARAAISHPASDAALGIAPASRTRERRRRARNRHAASDDAAPPAAPATAAPLLCPAFAERGRCAAGDACPDVHASLADATVLYPHVRPGLGLPAGRPAPRLPARLGVLQVAAPNDPAAVTRVAAASCLRTRAMAAGTAGTGSAGAPPRVWSLCAHFAKKGVCDFGAACVFVHCVDAPSPGGRAAGTPSTNACHQQHSTAMSHLGIADEASAVGSAPEDGDDGCVSPAPVGRTWARFQHDPYGQCGWVSSV